MVKRLVPSRNFNIYDREYTELTAATPLGQLNSKFYAANNNLVIKTTVGTAGLTDYSAKVRVWVGILKLLTQEE